MVQRLLATAQEAGGTATIGVLTATAAAEGDPRGLGEHGSVEGQIVLSEWRAADGRRDRAASLARELAQRNVDFIVVGLTPAAQARMRPAPIPIAMAPAGDPIGTGFAASLARPGRNMTGITGIGAELSGKQLDALRQLVPKLTSRAADQFLWGAFSKSMMEQTKVAAKSSGTFVQVVSVSRAEELEWAFTTIVDPHLRA